MGEIEEIRNIHFDEEAEGRWFYRAYAGGMIPVEEVSNKILRDASIERFFWVEERFAKPLMEAYGKCDYL